MMAVPLLEVFLAEGSLPQVFGRSDGVKAERFFLVRRIGQHTVPLQHLMQDDAIEEAAETETEQDPDRDRKACTVECVPQATF
jgi:hypothetical protein